MAEPAGACVQQASGKIFVLGASRQQQQQSWSACLTHKEVGPLCCKYSADGKPI